MKTTALRPLLAALALGGACLAAAAADTPQPGGATLVVGMAHLPPPHLPGAKVRTPDGVAIPVANALAERAGAQLQTVQVDAAGLAQPPAAHGARLTLASIVGDAPAEPGIQRIPTGYAARPMAIMRSDTDIKSWRQLAGRTVCLVQGSAHVGTLAERHGAIEMLYKTPTDALIGVRTGACDATVHDDRMLEELIKFPEWKKFSAALRGGPQRSVVAVVAADDADTARLVKAAAKDWHAQGYFDALMRSTARDLAFEVYLDQDVVDCH